MRVWQWPSSDEGLCPAGSVDRQITESVDELREQESSAVLPEVGMADNVSGVANSHVR